MVLRHAIVAAALTFVAAGCIKRNPPARLDKETPVAVAFVADPEGGGAAQDVPLALKEAVVAELGRRNLRAEVVPFETLAEAYSRVRATPRRFEMLREATKAPLMLLVETKPSFFSQISGRYRWVVATKLTGNVRAAQAEPTNRTYEEGVVLVFDHERGPEAIAHAAPRIAENAGTLFDDLLAVPAGVEKVSPLSPPAIEQQHQREPAAPPNEPAPGVSPTGALPQTGAIYFVMVDRFANGDPSNDGQVDKSDPQAFHGGDLQGVIDHLDELKALGVETVWLSPVFKMRTEKFFGHGAFHGYWVEDITEVEPRFGDRRLLRRLSDELHARGMKLLLDMVLNHVGPETPLVTQKPDWFHRAGPLEKWDDPVELVTKDVHGLPDLAQDKPEVYRHLLDASLMWIREVKPDGFRLDAVKHMPLSFWRKYNADIRSAAGEDFLLLGEMLDGDPRVLARTQREGDFTALFDFPLHFAVNDVFCKDQPATKLAVILSNDRMYEDAFSLVTLADNHDLPRVVSTCQGDLERVRQALLFTLLARGTPSLTWGTEAALEGAHEPENRKDMRFDVQPLRPFIERVMGAREKYPSLHVGVPMLLEVGPHRFAYARVTPDEVAIIAVNRGGETVRFGEERAVRAESWRDVLRDVELKAPELKPRSSGVFVARERGAFASLHARALREWKGEAPERRIVFKVKDLPGGGTAHLIGSAPELGAWDAARAPKVGGDGRVELSLPAGAVTEYKLVVRSAAGELQWEAGQNRTLFVSSGASPLEVPVQWKGSP